MPGRKRRRKITPLGFLDDGIFSPAVVRWWRGLDTGELCAEQFLISILKAAVTHNNQALHSARLQPGTDGKCFVPFLCDATEQSSFDTGWVISGILSTVPVIGKPELLTII